MITKYILNSTKLICLIQFIAISFSLTISGKVVNENGKKISNVNIFTETNGTTSQKNGKFRLNIDGNSLVTFSHIGYETIQLHKDNIPKVITLKRNNVLGENIYVNSSLDNRDLYNTPASINLFNFKRILNNSANHLEGLSQQVTNLNFSGGTSRPRYFQIRGIGERSHYAGEGAPNYSVSFIVDDIDFSGIGMIGHLFDVNQIEIFKGPQSTIFGPNAIAGSINITTNNPTPFYTGKIETIYSNDNMISHSGAFGGPLEKNLTFRVAGIKHFQNGFRKNLFLDIEDSNKKNETLYRTKLIWSPFEEFSIKFTHIFADLKNQFDVWSPDNNQSLNTYSDKLGNDTQKTTANSIKINLPELFKIKANYKFSNSNSTLIHSYDGDWGNDSLWINEYDWDPILEGYNYSFFDSTNRIKNTRTDEFVIKTTDNIDLPLKTKLIIGLYSSSIEQIDSASGYLYGGDATSLSSNFNIDNSSIYFNSNSKISNSLELNFNIRLEKFSLSYIGLAENYYNNNYYLDVNLPRVDTLQTNDFLGLNVSLKKRLNSDLLFYTTISKGYKAGGINQHPYLNSTSRLYNPEFNLNCEFGGRFSLNKIKLNFAIFMMQRTDLQVQISSQQIEGDPNSFIYYTSNASSGYNKGFELETSYSISQNLNFNYSFGYLKTHIEEFTYPYQDEIITTGNREQAMSPKFNSSLDLNYIHTSGFFINSNITSKDSYYFSDSHNEKSKPYSLLNINLGYKKENFIISIWSKNLTDQRYAIRGFYFGLEPPNYKDKLYLSYGNPKEIGIKLNYQF